MTTQPERPPLAIFAPGALALLIFAAYCGLWFYSASKMKAAVEAFAADHRAKSGVASYETLSVGGFPFFLRGKLTTVVLGDGKAYEWRAPVVFIDASPFSPRRLIFSAREAHELDLVKGGVWRIDAPDGRASVARDEAYGWRLDVEASDARISRLETATTLGAKRFRLAVAPDALETSRLHFGLDVDAVETRIGEKTLALEVVDAAFSVARAGAAKSLKDWRDQGGGVEVDFLRVEAAGADAALKGVLGIDGAGYPSGRLDAALVNPAPLADLLAAAGLIEDKDADLAKAGLGLAALAGGGKIDASLVLEGEEATVIGVRVAKLPQLIR